MHLLLCDDVPVCIVTFSLQKSFKDQIAKVEGGQPLGDLPKLPLPKPPQPPKTPMLAPAMVGHRVKDTKCIKQATIKLEHDSKSSWPMSLFSDGFPRVCYRIQ